MPAYELSDERAVPDRFLADVGRRLQEIHKGR